MAEGWKRRCGAIAVHQWSSTSSKVPRELSGVGLPSQGVGKVLDQLLEGCRGDDMDLERRELERGDLTWVSWR